jgi:ABC-type Fe3+/spermidine/putrescine transport system ATPase subunit
VNFGVANHLVACGAKEFRQGASVTIAIRPQRIQLRTSSSPGDNVLEGALKETIFVGAVVRFVIELAKGVLIQAENIPENLPFDFRLLRQGDRVELHVPRNAVLVYGADH